MEKEILHPGTWINTIGVEHPETGKIWEGVERRGTGQVVGVLVENISKHTFVLVEQFRPLMNAPVIECVAGLVDPGNTPEETIAKEILEETGYRAGQIDFLLSGPKSAGITTEKTLDYYVQVHGEAGAQQLEESEQGLIVHETVNSLHELKQFLEAQESLGKLISPGIWSVIGKALVDGKIAL